MFRLYFLLTVIHYVTGYNKQLCQNTQKWSCTTQIQGQELTDFDTCKVEFIPSNSSKCGSMNFGLLESNTHIGGVSLKPYILPWNHNDNYTWYSFNATALNITFSNIKWKTMTFRFQTNRYNSSENHCRNIMISKNVTMDEQSVLYYDCYWADTRGYGSESHILDFRATDDKIVNTGRYYFNIPSDKMLAETITREEWRPFIYIEMLTTTMRLHITPPPSHIKISEFEIKVIKDDVELITVKLPCYDQEVMYDYSWLRDSGLHYFVVTPFHDNCDGKGLCQRVESPKVKISNEKQTANVCIASVTALIVATLFACYIALRFIRGCSLRNYDPAPCNEILSPTRILAIYPPTNLIHAKCVQSFITYLRFEFGIDVTYDCDILSTPHKDPHRWALDSYSNATHIMFIVGPANNIYDGPVHPHAGVYNLLLSYVSHNRGMTRPKDVFNVFFEHSNRSVPKETSYAKSFNLLKDWHKLISYLSKNLLPKKQIMLTEKGRCFIEELSSAKKLLIDSGIQHDV